MLQVDVEQVEVILLAEWDLLLSSQKLFPSRKAPTAEMVTNLAFATDPTTVFEILAVFNDSLVLVSE